MASYWLESGVSATSELEAIDKMIDMLIKARDMPSLVNVDFMVEADEGEEVCIRCGEVITDDNRSNEYNYFGPDSGYCNPCAAWEE